MIETTIKNMGYVDSAASMQLHQVAQQSNNDSLLAISYNIIGTYFLVTKDDDITALEYLFKAIPLAEKTKDKRRISSIYFDIALVNFKLQNLENALKYTEKGGENMPDKSSSVYYFMEAQYEGNMAGYYLFKNESDSALHYAQRLAETSRHSKIRLHNYYAQYLNGGAYGLLGDNEMAEIYQERSCPCRFSNWFAEIDWR